MKFLTKKYGVVITCLRARATTFAMGGLVPFFFISSGVL